VNLYGFASGDPINFSDPFGLCPDDKNPKCVGKRDLTPQEGEKVLAAAVFFMDLMDAAGTTYHLQDGSQLDNTMDCSKFCTLSQSVLGQTEHVSTGWLSPSGGIASSEWFRPVPASEARAGDRIVQQGHMGIYAGVAVDARGGTAYLAVDMGKRGPSQPYSWFGPGGHHPGGSAVTFYRPLLKAN